MAAGQPQEVQFPFSIDLSQFISQIERANQLVGTVTTAATNAQAGVQQAFNQTTRAEAQTAAAAQQATAAITQQATATAGLTQATTRQATAAATTATATTTAMNATTAATTRAVGAQNLFVRGFNAIKTAANILPGLGISGAFLLIFEGIKLAAEQLGVFADEAKNFSVGGKKFTEELQNTSKAVVETQVSVSALQQRIISAGNSFAEKEAILKDYNKEFGTTIGHASSINDLERILIERAPEYIKILGLKARAQAATNLALKEGEKGLKLQLEFGQKLADARAVDASIADGTGNLIQNSAFAQFTRDLREANKNVDALNKIAAEAENAANAAAKAGGYTLDKKQGEKNAKDLEALNKRLSAERERAAKEALEQQKNYNNLLAKLLNDEQALQAKAIEDNRESEIAASDARFDQMKKDRKREIDQAKVTEVQRADLLKEFLNFEQDATDAAAKARLEINKKYDDQELKLRQAALKAIAELGDNAQQEELNKIKQRYVEQAQVIDAGGQLTADVRKKLAENEQREIDEVNIKFGNERIKKQEELDIVTTKVSEKYAGKSVDIERKKQLDIIDIQINAQLDRIELLKANGRDINSLEVKQAQQALSSLEEARGNIQKGDGKSLFDLLGVGEDGQKDIERYGQAAQTAGKIVSDFTQVFVDGYDRQLKAKQALIDQDNKEIDDLESRLEKERELKDQGFANDFDRLQNELAAKKAQREEDLKQAQEIEKKKQAAQKVQLIADTISQASNLITASTEIFKTFSALGPFGVPLAITTIGLMIGAFAAAKIQAFKAIGETKTFGEGGEIDGESHSRGGKKYYAADGNVTELEGGEYVINKRSTRRALPIIEAINDGSFFNMHPESLEQMLAARGISLPKDQPQQMIHFVAQRDEAVRLAAFTGGNPALDAINNNVQYLADKKRTEEIIVIRGGIKYVKRGNVLTKVNE